MSVLSTPAAPYFDDFDKQKDFLRIIFNPSRAVQARELTQLQTILQNQIASFGDSIFKENSRVIGAETTVKFNVITLVVNTVNSESLTTAISPMLNQTIEKVGDAGTTATITNIDAANNRVLLSVHGGSFLATDQFFVQGAAVGGSGNRIDYTINSIHNSAIAYINDGIVYSSGMFVNVHGHNLVVDTTPTMATKEFNIGFTITDTFVDFNTDSSLTDNAAGSFNFNAPGADRLKRTLSLASYEVVRDVSLVETSTPPAGFTKVLLINLGVVKSDILKYTKYSEILDIFARRTHDESGDYVVHPFDIFTNDTVAGNTVTQFDIKVGAGKAYVNGYEVENQQTVSLTLDKAQTTTRINNQQVTVASGAYFDIDTAAGSISKTFDLTNNEIINFYSSVGGTGTLLGTGRISSIVPIPNSVGIRIYFTEYANMSSVFTSVRSVVGSTSTAFANVALLNGVPVYSITGNNDSILALMSTKADENIASIIPNTISYDVIKSFIGLTGSTTFILNASDTTTNFYTTAGILYVTDGTTGTELAAGTDYNYVANNVNGSISSLTITTVSVHTSISATVKMYKSAGNARTKTLSKSFLDVITSTAGGVVTLTNSDILSVISVEDNTIPASPVLISPSTYVVDNGQRDYIYDVGSITGLSPNTSYKITYDYFIHSGTGDYFSVDSYLSVGNLDAVTGYTNLYSRIGEYTAQDNTKYKLINCIDFRHTGADFSSSDSIAQESQNFQFDFNYYLPRIDKLVLDRNGIFSLVTGIPSTVPKMPEDIVGQMTIALISIQGYTHLSDDVNIMVFSNKRFTMEQIGQLEKRIADIEQYTSLSLLEQDVSQLHITDANGQNRYKNGIFVDPFLNHLNGDTTNPDYNCSMDFDYGELNVNDVINNFKFLESSTLNPAPLTTANIRKHEDLVIPAESDETITLDYTEVVFIEQNLHSDVVNVNPYAATTWRGKLAINPTSDTWFDTNYLPQINRSF